VQPALQLTSFGKRKLIDCRLDFFDRAHVTQILDHP
jgi:hypothetical protein